MATKLNSAAKTDVGRKRDVNEDVFMVMPQQGLYLLADGMGGHASGQVASRLAVTSVSQYICEIARQPGFRFEYKTNPAFSYEANLLSCAIQYANERVYIQSCKDRSMEGMGTTITAIFNAPHAFVLAHVGDSRIYRLRDGQLLQISKDHSLLNHLIDSGEIRAEDAGKFSNKNVILRAIGLKDTVDVEIKEVARVQGDVYLMCSDGLSDLVGAGQIAKSLIETSSLNDACDRLVNLANNAGGKDNITVVCIEIEQEDDIPVSATPMVSQTRMRPVGGVAGGLGGSYPTQAPPFAAAPAPAISPHGPPPNARAMHVGAVAQSPVHSSPVLDAVPLGMPPEIRQHSVREPCLCTLDSVERGKPKTTTSMPAIPISGKLKPVMADALAYGAEAAPSRSRFAGLESKAQTDADDAPPSEKERKRVRAPEDKHAALEASQNEDGIREELLALAKKNEEEQVTRIQQRPKFDKMRIQKVKTPEAEVAQSAELLLTDSPKLAPQLAPAELLLHEPPQLPSENQDVAEHDDGDDDDDATKTQIELPVLNQSILRRYDEALAQKSGDSADKLNTALAGAIVSETTPTLPSSPIIPEKLSEPPIPDAMSKPASPMSPPNAPPLLMATPPSLAPSQAPAPAELIAAENVMDPHAALLPPKQDASIQEDREEKNTAEHDSSDDSIVIDPSLLEAAGVQMSNEDEEIDSDEVTRRFNPFSFWKKSNT
ncbi:MAG: Stp1/IreP family PP2C-type Ser/Thr phosphatase [Bradymonadia bacterium]|jgi:serine/threonine protein phosphatase PrpC